MAQDIKHSEAIELPAGAGDNADDIATLEIVTTGESGTVYTRATVNFSQPPKPEDFFSSSTHRLFHDFSERPASEKKRATAKALQTQHAQVMATIADIRARAIAHYKAKAGESVNDGAVSTSHA